MGRYPESWFGKVRVLNCWMFGYTLSGCLCVFLKIILLIFFSPRFRKHLKVKSFTPICSHAIDLNRLWLTSDPQSRRISFSICVWETKIADANDLSQLISLTCLLVQNSSYNKIHCDAFILGYQNPIPAHAYLQGMVTLIAIYTRYRRMICARGSAVVSISTVPGTAVVF